MAVRHIALFQWMDSRGPDLGEVNEVLSAVVGDHGGWLESGGSRGLSPSTFDFGLTVDFVSDADYLAYRNDPRHQRLMDEVIRPAARHICAVQIDLA